MSATAKDSDVKVIKVHRYSSVCFITVGEMAHRCHECGGSDITEQLLGDPDAPCIVPSVDICVKHPNLTQIG